ncbi:MAG TPA: ATP-binding protein [Anaeromyxobacter sp.]|nr:ATP-binding protein [Anaeromyxobacter sp.]
MRLRTQLAALLALFAVLPLLCAVVPMVRALSRGLAHEHEARLDGAARALAGELARLSEDAAARVGELARSPEAEAFARDLASGAVPPADAATRGAEWMRERGLEVLSLTTSDGLVVTSGHLPGRAGDRDPELAPLLSGPAGEAEPRVLTRAGPLGPEPVMALVAWTPLPGDYGLELVGGLNLSEDRARRLAALTNGEVVIRSGAGAVLAQASAPAQPGRPLLTRIGARLGVGLTGARRVLPLGPTGAEVGQVEVSVAAEGLAEAAGTVLAALLAALAAGALAAVVAGRLVALRVTRPVEALREAAARVAAGDLTAQVGIHAAGEMGELVRAFNAMTQDLQTGRARLAQAERVAAWREVARRLAHEIKNPLTPIAMGVETLREARAAGRPDFAEIFDEGTRAIGEEVRRLKRIVDEFSRFARLPAPERAAVSTDDLVSSVLALFPPAPGLVIERRVEAGLPPLWADRDQIVQVLHNLLRNAVEAMPGGGALLVSARGEDGGVVLEVTDNGPGIAPEDLSRVFEPYFTRKEGGTGLGLAIAQRIAEEHGGRLAVTSPPGAGATFTLWVPAAPDEPGRRAG